MKISQDYPPNYQQINALFPFDEYHPVVAYGDTIYAPHHEHVPDDVIEHEKVHAAQQQAYTSPDVWWNKYILDTDFRKSQEVEAFAKQYHWIKNTLGNRIAKEALTELALNLSSRLYSLGITFNQAETLIRKYG